MLAAPLEEETSRSCSSPSDGDVLGGRAPQCTRRDVNQGDKDGQATLTTGEERLFRVCDRPRAVARSVLAGWIREKRKQVTALRRLEDRVPPGLAHHRIARQGVQEERSAHSRHANLDDADRSQ